MSDDQSVRPEVSKDETESEDVGEALSKPTNRERPRPLTDILEDLKTATGGGQTGNIAEASKDICTVLGLGDDPKGTVKELIYRAAEMCGTPTTFEEMVTIAETKAHAQTRVVAAAAAGTNAAAQAEGTINEKASIENTEGTIIKPQISNTSSIVDDSNSLKIENEATPEQAERQPVTGSVSKIELQNKQKGSTSADAAEANKSAQDGDPAGEVSDVTGSSESTDQGDAAKNKPGADAIKNIEAFEISLRENSSNEGTSTPKEKHRIVETSPEGRFQRFDELLGRGSFKKVYKAYDSIEGCMVAWNMVTLPKMNEKDKTSLLREVKLLHTLQHDNILQFRAAFVLNQRQDVVFITEILEGSLKDFLARRIPVRWVVVKRWMRDILKGLIYLHEQNPPILHRDIKCDNVFIDQRHGHIRIGDLGLARRISEEHSQDMTLTGTTPFMAPEMCDINASYGTKIDVYAVGMLLIEIITQEVPYRECKSSIPTIMVMVREGQPPKALERIKNQDALDFIALCRKNNPVDRPTARELYEGINGSRSMTGNFVTEDRKCEYDKEEIPGSIRARSQSSFEIEGGSGGEETEGIGRSEDLGAADRVDTSDSVPPTGEQPATVVPLKPATAPPLPPQGNASAAIKEDQGVV